MKQILKITILFSCLITFSSVSAHPGNTDTNGCHTCRTNCAKWGLSNGQYHCHNGGSSSTSTTSNPTPALVPKSNNAKLSAIIIDGVTYNNVQNVTLTTKKETISLNAMAEDTKANIILPTDNSLIIGENMKTISVTAENGDVVVYNVKIIRETLLSNNTNVKVKIDGEEVYFISDKWKQVDVNHDVKKLNIKTLPEDENTKVEITGNNLKEGENIIKIKITAEDGTKKELEIKVSKSSEVGGLITGLVTLGAITGGTTYFINKKIKTKKGNNIIYKS